MVCDETPESMTKAFFSGANTKDITMPSAAAVASSNSDAFAMSMEVNDMTMVWKLTKDSSRPGDQRLFKLYLRHRMDVP
jgi:hypothetical protein